METHAHELHKAPSHGWKHYFFEFFMLFLAVFCGFLAENFRENFVEHEREEEYVHSLLNDLVIDSSSLHQIIVYRNEREITLDSLMLLLKMPEPAQYSHSIYYHNSFASRYGPFQFYPDDGTLQQLKNAGNLRLIRNVKVRDSIMSYDVEARKMEKNDDVEVEMAEAYRTVAQEIFDGSELEKTRDQDNNVKRLPYDAPLKNSNDAIFRLIYRIHMLENFNRANRKENKILLRKAVALLLLLKNEYHLQ